jgi:hypothetical protein
MNIIERVKNILFSPKTEWSKINTEPGSLNSLIMSYTIIVTGIGAIGIFIGEALIGYHGYGYTSSVKISLINAILNFICVVATVVAGAYIADALAPNLGAEKDKNKSAQWSVYGFTPLCLALLLGIIPGQDTRWYIGVVGFIYSFYLLYVGAPVLKKAIGEKTIPYTAVVLGACLVIFILLSEIFDRIKIKILF